MQQKTITAEMSPGEAEALAQLVKRLCWDEIRSNSVDEEEAYTMRDALERLRVGLALAGFSPR